LPRLTVRYFAAARAAAGTSSETVDAGSLDDALDTLRSRHDQRFATVLQASSLLLDGVHVGNDQGPLLTDAELDVLPPFAGG
jgi:molybdopterin synthase sulfur carrier subunit